MTVLKKKFFFKISTENFEKYSPFLVPPGLRVLVLSNLFTFAKREFFLARFEFFTTTNILGKLQVGAGKISIEIGHFSFLKISHVDFP